MSCPSCDAAECRSRCDRVGVINSVGVSVFVLWPGARCPVPYTPDEIEVVG